jgi:hypothetical protein
MGSDTPGPKMFSQLKKACVAAGNKTEFEIPAEESSQALSKLLTGTANIGW